MRDPWSDSELAQHFVELAASSTPRAPLNAALSRVIATAPDLSGLLGHAPRTQRQPVLLLAAIHRLVLDEPDSDLAAWYPNLTVAHLPPDDPRLGDALRRFVHDRAPAVLDLVASRRTQTNEVGRSGFFLPAMGLIEAELDRPLVHVDVGTSGGLNLLLPHFAYRYDDGPTIGSSPVAIDVSTRGAGPTPATIPRISHSVGLDSAPLDVTKPEDARWLEACCWPDQADRFHRLRAAIDLFERYRPDVVAGDAVADVGPVIDRHRHLGHPVVTTSWVLNYLTPDARRGFMSALDSVGANTDLSWIAAESPAQTPELPHCADLVGEHLTELTLTSWRGGERHTRFLGTCHPHGYWIHWA